MYLYSLEGHRVVFSVQNKTNTICGSDMASPYNKYLIFVMQVAMKCCWKYEAMLEETPKKCVWKNFLCLPYLLNKFSFHPLAS